MLQSSQGQGPWNERRSTHEEERQFNNLVSLHSLTHQWTQAILGPKEEAAIRIERMPKITLRQNLWLLEKIRLDESLTELNTLVGDQKISEFLTELCETIWLIQISTLENAFTETKDASLLMNLLKNSSFTHGKKMSEHLWSNLQTPHLNASYRAFTSTHVDGEKSFLLNRFTGDELSFYWILSPHQNLALNTSPQIDALCSLHREFIQGFFYGLSRKIRVSSKSLTINGNHWIEFNLLWTY